MAIRYVDIEPDDGKAPKVPKAAAKPLPAEPPPPAPDPDAAPPAPKAGRKRR